MSVSSVIVIVGHSLSISEHIDLLSRVGCRTDMSCYGPGGGGVLICRYGLFTRC